MAEFVAQAFQFPGDAADRRRAFLLAADAVDVARKRLVGCARLRPCCLPGLVPGSRPRLLVSGPTAAEGLCLIRMAAVGSRFAATVEPALEILEGAVQFLERGAVPPRASGIQCVEIGPLAVHRNVRLPNRAGVRPARQVIVGEGATVRRTAGRFSRPGGFWPRLENRVQCETGEARDTDASTIPRTW